MIPKRDQQHGRKSMHHHDKHAAAAAGHRHDDPHGVTAEDTWQTPSLQAQPWQEGMSSQVVSSGSPSGASANPLPPDWGTDSWEAARIEALRLQGGSDFKYLPHPSDGYEDEGTNGMAAIGVAAAKYAVGKAKDHAKTPEGQAQIQQAKDWGAKKAKSGAEKAKGGVRKTTDLVKSKLKKD
jgi:hypothetical protein